MKKNIVFFSKNLNVGGMEKALVNLLNVLVDYYNITLFLEEYKGDLINDINKDIRIREYKIYNNKNILIRKLKNYIKRIFFIIKNFNKYDFSCCFATYSIPCAKLALLASKNNSLYVHSDYYYVFNKNENFYKNFYKNIFFQKFKNIIFVSNESRNNFINIFGTKYNTMVINNIIDYKNIINLSNKKINFKFDKNYINFLYVGRLDNSSKNLDLLINSFSIAINKSPKIKLYIIGEGDYKENLINKINSCNLKENIELLGKKVNPYPYIKECDCMVLSSNYEGFPVIYNEALVLNKQVITTINVSDDYFMINKYFEIVDQNEKSIAEKILSFKKNKIDYNIDFKKINAKKINKLKKII